MCYYDKNYIKNGYSCFYPQDNKLLTYLDNTFKGYVDKLSECEEYHIPALIDGEVLNKCGYFKSFPQHLTIAAFVKEEHYDSVVRNKEVKPEYIGTTNKYFTPAACLHIYPMLENLENVLNRIITTKARVYRYEGESFSGLTRLWDFTVREIVIIGDPDYVVDMENKIKEKVLLFAKKITDKARIVSACDHFYPSRENEVKVKMQKVNPLKYELSMPIKGEDIAVASFNYHHTHFSKAFNFDCSNKIVTGCVGFGLERWIAGCKEYKFDIGGLI